MAGEVTIGLDDNSKFQKRTGKNTSAERADDSKGHEGRRVESTLILITEWQRQANN